MRYPLVDGQGNFGSVDGDGAAAMRYTEARLTAMAVEMLDDIDKDTVDFEDAYDGPQQQPYVLPAKLPNLLINGSPGIAVGIATNIPPHHLGEGSATRRSPSSTTRTSRSDDLCQLVQGPDFPTGGTIYRYEQQRNVAGEWETVDAIRQMYAHGRGRVETRAQVAFEEVRGDRMAIIVTELPYQVNKASLLEKMGDLSRSRRSTVSPTCATSRTATGCDLHRDQARREPAQGAQQPVQAHPDAARLQHEHAGARRWPAADAAAQERPPALRRPPPRHRPAPEQVRPRKAAAGPTSSRASRSPSTTSTR